MPYIRENRDEIEGVGVNIDEPHCGVFEHFEIKYCSAHELPWEDEYFDCVISVSMLEHDPMFWLSVEQMRRVLKKGAPMIIGVPGFVNFKSCVIKKWSYSEGHGTACYKTHGDPDCYRFSPHFFEYYAYKGFSDLQIYVAKMPPRLIGIGYK